MSSLSDYETKLNELLQNNDKPHHQNDIHHLKRYKEIIELRTKVAEEKVKRDKSKEPTEENFKRALKKRFQSLSQYMETKEYHESPQKIKDIAHYFSRVVEYNRGLREWKDAQKGIIKQKKLEDQKRKTILL